MELLEQDALSTLGRDSGVNVDHASPRVPCHAGSGAAASSDPFRSEQPGSPTPSAGVACDLGFVAPVHGMLPLEPRRMDLLECDGDDSPNGPRAISRHHHLRHLPQAGSLLSCSLACDIPNNASLAPLPGRRRACAMQQSCFF